MLAAHNHVVIEVNVLCDFMLCVCFCLHFSVPRSH